MKEDLQAFLGVPGDTDPRIRALAASLARQAGSVEERLARTVAHLQSGAYRYSLEVGEFHSDQPLAEFLFEKRKGYCEYFASAAAILLRLQGVPTRFVGGFLVIEESPWRDQYVVRQSHAHAWIEACLPGRGWVEADPTPPQALEAMGAGEASRTERVLEWLRAAMAQIASRVDGGRGVWRWLRKRPWVPPLALLALLALRWAVLRALDWWRMRSGRARGRRSKPGAEGFPVPADLVELLGRLDRTLARAGHARPPTRAPLEHLRGLSPEGLPPGLVDTAAKVVDCYYRACFGGQTVPGEEIAEIDRRMRGLE